MGERRWRATQEAGLRDDPGDRARDRRRRHAARRAAGEPAPLPAQPAGGGGGLPAAARRLRLHPRRARRADRPLPPADQQHAAAAEPLACRPAPGRRRRALAPATPGRCSASRTPTPRTGSPAGSSPRGSPCAASRRSSPSASTARTPTLRACARRGRPRPGLTELADRLCDRLETRVKVDLGTRKGKITDRVRLADDLERIVDDHRPAQPRRQADLATRPTDR